MPSFPLRISRALTILLALLLLAPAAHAQFGGGGGGAGGREVTLHATPSRTTAAPGDQVIIAIIFDHADGWHVWPAEHVQLPDSIDPFAIRTTISLPEELPAWITPPQGIHWPDAKPTPVANPMGGDPIDAPTYGGRAIAYLPITVAPTAAPGDYTFPIDVAYQACDDNTCLMPEDATLTISLSIAPGAPFSPNQPDLFTGFDAAKVTPFDGAPATPSAPSVPSETAPAPAASQSSPPPSATIFGFDLGSSLILIAIASILGGAILNLTPCVLPVIPIKVMTLVQHAGGSRRRTLALGVWMALGVVAFWFAAGLPMALFSAALDPSRLIFGTWWVTTAIGLLIALMGLGIMGLFVINLPQSVYMVETKADSPSGSFMFGVMTAVLGLPCFGFVAGALLAGAATMPTLNIMVIFLGLGVGMAAPYLVLSAYPGLVSKVPRTGPASELVKQVMGLLLLAAAAFFIAAGLKALLSEKPWLRESIAWWAVAFFIIVAGLWLTLRTLQIAKKTWPKVVFPVLSLFAIAGSVVFANGFSTTAREDYLRIQQAQGQAAAGAIVTGAWLPYTPATLEQARAAGHIVVADFTADWCINCKALRRGVLDRDPVRSRITAGDVVLIEVDLTSSSAPGWQFLADLGRSNVPTLAIFGPGSPDPIIYNAYTPDLVLTAISQVGRTASAPGPATPPGPLSSAPGAAESADALVTGSWLDYTPALFEQTLASNQVVLANVYGEWCNHGTIIRDRILDKEPVRSRLAAGDVVLIKINLTSTSAPGWQFLADLGRSNVPALAIFGPGAPSPIIYNACTPELVLSAISQAAAAAPPAATPSPAPSALGRSN